MLQRSHLQSLADLVNQFAFQALVYLSHGFGEHLEWYDELSVHLCETGGFLVFGHDHSGHGLSEGPRGSVDDVDHFVNDVIFHVTKVRLFLFRNIFFNMA